MTTREQTDSVRDHLQAMCNRARGNLTAEAVVRDATRKESVLHPYFEWNDGRAAHQYRIEQARELIRGVHIVYESHAETLRVPAYVRNPSASRGYVPVTKLRTDRERAREALLTEIMLVHGALDRARRVACALDLSDQIESLLRGVLDVRAILSGAEA
ncbi:hypothetical protein [Paraburkholderia adhaesiva]|uniref:hypothetical protein n=1 Tax=Paraburkholderia adhaesiva TaxID=2883244 RepID=UPI001F3AE546|nr:hypothetical protein [Paraburkholderia adhaesiva]